MPQVLVEPVTMFAVRQSMDISAFGPGVAAVLPSSSLTRVHANAAAMHGLHLVELDFLDVLPLDS